MKKIFSALAIAATFLLLATPAFGQKTKSQLNSEVATNYPDNSTGLITPAIVRTTTNDQIASWVDWLTCTGTGGIVFWNAGTPTCLNIGSTGQFLQVVAGAPSWQNIAGALTSGSGITITGTTNATVSFATITNLDLLANISGGAAVPSQTTGTAYLDAVFGSTRGNILVRGASTWGTLALGTNGQQLVSNGTDLVYGTGTASKANVQTFTASGTWTKPGGFGATAQTHIQCWGGGGSGAAVGIGAFSSGGGGGGGYNEIWVPLSTLSATVTVTVGAGGAGVTANSVGNSGGTTTFGAVLSAFGGGGGGFLLATGNDSGGGGGGQFSTGAVGSTVPSSPGGPIHGQNSTDGFKFADGAGDDNTNSTPGGVLTGGGGGGANSTGQQCSAGRPSVWGGGGGGGVSDNSFVNGCAGGTSQYGGTGGAGGNSTHSGTQPGGGGGGIIGGTSGSGGAGQCIAVTIDGT
jgi:hypothetical protein